MPKLAKTFEDVLTRSRGKATPASPADTAGSDIDTFVRRIMNSPATLAGLLVAAHRGAQLELGPAGSIQAEFDDPSQMVDPQTLGEVMLIPRRFGGNEDLVTHELGHVAQGGTWGPFLPAASGVAAAVQGYDDSIFEGERAMEAGRKERKRAGYSHGGPVPKKKKRKKAAAGGVSTQNHDRRRFANGGSTKDQIAALVSPENLLNAVYQARYGMNMADKVKLADTGKALGVSPERAQADPVAADRATSAYLAGQKYGEAVPNAGQAIRDAVKFWSAVATGNDPLTRSSAGQAEGSGIDLRMGDIVRGAARRGAGESVRGERAGVEIDTPPDYTLVRGSHGGRLRAAVGGIQAGGATPRPYGNTGPMAPKPAPKPAPKKAPGGGGTLAQQSFAAYQRGEKNLPAGMDFNTYKSTYFSGGGGGGGNKGGGAKAGGTFGQAQGVAGQLQNFQPGGGQDINALRGFTPLQGQARTTQDELLTTGAKTDVSGITDAAQIRGQQEFEGLSDTLNERYAAMGLGSSTAREAALGRERGRIAGGIAATGLEAEVGAQEAATGRRFGAVGNELGASGQVLGATSSALQGSLGQSGQRLGALGQAAGTYTDLTGIAEGGRQFDVGSSQQAQQFNARLQHEANLANQNLAYQQNALEANLNANAGAYGTYGGGGSSVSPVARGGVGAGGYYGTGRYGGAHGGRTNAPDFFSRVAYGRTFDSPGTAKAPDLDKVRSITINRPTSRGYGAEGRTRTGPSENELREQRNREGREAALNFQRQKELMAYQSDLARKSEEQKRMDILRLAENLGARQAQNLGGGQVRPVPPGAITGLGLQALRANAGVFGLSDATGDAGFSASPESIVQAQKNFSSPTMVASQRSGWNVQSPDKRVAERGRYAHGGPVRQYGAGGGIPQPELPGEQGISYPALIDPRRQFYADGGPTGGEVPGIDDGTDKVPAMLRSEELVVTPELVAEIESADPLIPHPELILDLQELAMKPLEYSPEEGEFAAASGGQAPLFQSFGELFSFLEPKQDPEYEALLRAAGKLPPTPEMVGGATEEERAAIGLPPRQSIPDSILAFNGRLPSSVAEAIGLPGPGIEESFDDVPGGLGDTQLAPPPKGSVSLSIAGGGNRLTKGGDAGFGQITPQPGRQGSFSAMTSTVPSAQPKSPEEQRYAALAAAQNRRDNIQASINTDPVGSPQKQARMFNALQAADQQVNSLVMEIDAAEKRKIATAQTQVAGAQAMANLNDALANQLRAQAQMRTADAATAKVLLDAAAQDPTLANLMNILTDSGLAKTDRGAEIGEAILNQHLQGLGVQITENGWFRRMLGAPKFEFAATPESAVPPRIGAAGGGLTSLVPEAQAALAQFLGV